MIHGIKKYYSTHIIRKLLLTALVLAVIILVVRFIPVLMVKSTPLDGYAAVKYNTADGEALSAVTGELAIDKKDVVVAENTGRQLLINTEDMIIKIKDTKTKKTWQSAVKNSTDAAELALFYITYLGENDVTYEWNSYQYCTELKAYTVSTIENGIQLNMHLSEGESAVYYEYMPRKMSITRYEEFFVKGITKLRDDGIITEEKYNTYSTTIGLVYKKSVKDACYVITYTGTPPASAVKQLIEVTKLLGYTTDMLISDAAEFGLSVVFTEPAEFDMTMEITLENGELLVRIPTEKIISVNDYYVVQNIDVLPNFGAVTTKQSEAGGFMLIPDGSGAIMALNEGITDVVEYERPIYNNNYYADYYFMPEYGEELTMPVFGMSYNEKKQGESYGFLAIIEEGAETSYIHTRQATSESGGATCNKVYTSVDLVQYSKIKVYGAYSDLSTSYLVATDPVKMDYKLRYLLLSQNADYYSMAAAYKNYLLEHDENITKLVYEESGRIYLEVIGALTIQERFLGIPYRNVVSMTDYKELQGILEELDIESLSVTYNGVFNDGCTNSMYNGAELVSENGSRAELTALLEFADSRSIDLFMGTTLSRVHEESGGFYPELHAVKDFADMKLMQYRYLPVLGWLSGSLSSTAMSYYTITPEYLGFVTDAFLKEAEAYGSLYIEDLASIYYADYDNSDMVSVYTANKVLDENLRKLAEKRLALNNPWMSKIGFGALATDISRQSCGYKSFTESIPFRQLVMNGILPYTTTPVNTSSKDDAYFVLQAVELGAYPKFVISHDNEDILKNGNYSYMYCIEYAKLKSRIKAMYSECSEAWRRIGSLEIAGHRIITDGVYETVYAGGVSVITNYNLYDVILEDETVIGAQSYLIR